MKIPSCLLACGVRNLVFLLAILGCLLVGTTALRAQMSDEEKRRIFPKAREDIRPVAKPSPAPAARPKPQPAATPRRVVTPPEKLQWVVTPTPKPTQKPRPQPSPTPRRISTPAPTPKPVPAAKPREEPPAPVEKPSTEKPEPVEDSEDYLLIPGEDKGQAAPPSATAEEQPKPTPVAQPQIPKGKTPAGNRLDAPILIEKSGLQDDAGFEPASRPLFGGLMKRYRHLTPAVRKAIDTAKVKRGRWKYIIVHNSGTRQGNARIFDNYHKRVRKMSNGLAYHFVIGNGRSSGNGEIEIGNRWTRQINGGHVASNYLNDIAIGICLVGDLNRDLPTKEQLAALDELCNYLRGRVGKVKGQAAIVKGHKEINPKPTDCPGDRFPLGWLRKRFGK